jgi:hypothetical protein
MNQFNNAPPPPFATQTHYAAPPPPAQAPPPPFAAQPQYAPPPAYAQPAPLGFVPQPLPAAAAPAFAPQGFPPAAAPQGFSAPMPDTDLNGVAVTGDALFPQIQGVYDLQIVGFTKRNGFKGVAYWISVKVLSSTAPEIQTGAVFAFRCQLASGNNTGGDQRRKAVLAAAYAQDPNAAIDWNALSNQTAAMHLETQPLFAHLRMVTNFSKPMLDPNTKQPTGQYWCRETWLKAQPRA